MSAVGQHLRVEAVTDSDWIVYDRHGASVATVEWYPHWRRHILSPDPGAVFSSDCLRDLSEWLRGLDAAREPRARRCSP